ncbi:MAG: CRISPR-associated endonuclease Cas2 [Erysipelotrichaceae bacterium]|nr:CRISPR-associated endonuclease Cas2 [Erysipelotrichaceae bacterium]
MLILITYDVSTETKSGKNRLRKVAKSCENYGQRVQNSVFECEINMAQYKILKSELKSIINEDEDNLRFYQLNDKEKGRVEECGRRRRYDPKGIIMI